MLEFKIHTTIYFYKCEQKNLSSRIHKSLGEVRREGGGGNSTMYCKYAICSQARYHLLLQLCYYIAIPFPRDDSCKTNNINVMKNNSNITHILFHIRLLAFHSYFWWFVYCEGHSNCDSWIKKKNKHTQLCSFTLTMRIRTNTLYLA